MTELLARFRSAERLEDCLQSLADTRAVAGCVIVGFKEGYQGPAVERIPRPQYWARQFGWPANFMRKWLSTNVSRASLMPEGARSRPDAVVAWSVPDPDDPTQRIILSEEQALARDSSVRMGFAPDWRRRYVVLPALVLRYRG